VARFASYAASVLLAAALAAVTFGAQGGKELTRTTITEMAVIVACGLVIALSIVFGRRRPIYGATAVVAFGVLVAVTALSMLWSIVPDVSWQETSRITAYFFVFTAAVASVRLSPDGWGVALRGIAIAGGVILGYTLASRVWPGTLADNEIFARLGKPYGYSNAVGLTAAMILPVALWLGARRSGHAAGSVLAYPLTTILLAALVLSLSRSSIAAAIVGVALWLIFVPLRLRTLTVLAASGALATPVIVWAASRDAFSTYAVLLPTRESVAPEFGLLVLAMLVLATLVGLAAQFRLTRPPATRTRLRVGVAAAAAAILVPVVAAGALAATDSLPDPNETTEVSAEERSAAGGPRRLVSATSSRGEYWRDARAVFDERTLSGTGAGTFATARLQVRDDDLVVQHAHGYVVETMADLGIVGLVASGLALLAVLLAVARAIGLWRGMLRSRFDAERVGLVALALVAAVFGVQSALDWTWFVPGTTAIALVALGWLAGRGPLVRKEPEATAENAAEPTPSRTPRIVLAVAAVATALLAAWAAWQPERSDAASERALRLIGDDKLDEAADAAEDARDINRLAAEPLLVRAAVEDARGNQQATLDLLEQAVREHPAEPQVWARLADYQLHGLNRPHDAERTVRAALKLDPESPTLRRLFFESQARIRPTPPPPATPPVPPAGPPATPSPPPAAPPAAPAQPPGG
jgi:hypothetical protein